MPHRAAESCAQPDLVHALADGRLTGEEKRRAEQLLARSPVCRDLFRQLTFGRFVDIPNYTILEQVGRGGFGIVYKAIHHHKERIEALKLLSSEAPVLTSYFQAEVHHIARLRHPHIATLFEAQLSSTPNFYAMEFVEGQRLNDYLKSREVTLAERIEIVRRVADALNYAHGQGVVHRDVKPQNVLIDHDGAPHIVDFGISKRVTSGEIEPLDAGRPPPPTTPRHSPPPIVQPADLDPSPADPFAAEADDESTNAITADGDTRPMKLEPVASRDPQPRGIGAGYAPNLAPGAYAHEGPVGTLGYIAPEQVRGGPTDPRTDIFSLGAMLFNVVTGEPARFARDQARTLELLRERRVGQPEDLAAIIARCVADNPAHRYTNCAALAADLGNYLAGRPISARTDAPVGYRATRIVGLLIRNHPITVRVAITACVAALLVTLLHTFNARFLPFRPDGDHVRIVAYRESTYRAIREGRLSEFAAGFDPARPRSRRLLHAALLRKLSVAGPRVVVFDYYMPEPEPEFDPVLIQAIQELGAPWVVGAAESDVNGEPLVARELRFAAHSVGTIAGVNPNTSHDELQLPAAAARGGDLPFPGLALAGFGAARFPDSTLSLHVVNEKQLQVRYRKRHVGPNELRLRGEFDLIPLVGDSRIREADTDADTSKRLVEREDIVHRFRFPAGDPGSWNRIVFSVEEVLLADPAKLQEQFAGKAVLVGDMLAGIDRYTMRSGATIYGVQVHAIGLNSLLRGASFERLDRRELGLRCLLWSGLGALLLTITPLGPRRFGLIVAGSLFAIGAGIALGVATAAWVTNRWELEAGIGAAAVLVSFGACALFKAQRVRQLEHSPNSIHYPHQPGSQSTTLMASTGSASA